MSRFGDECPGRLSARRQPTTNVEMAAPGRHPLFASSRRPSVVVTFSAILVAGAASGCASSSGNGEPPCFPPAFSVNPSSAKPGDEVTVTAPDAGCNPRYGGQARIQVTVTDAASVEVINATAPMNDAGGFIYTFEVPAQTAAGEAAVSAIPYNIDWCDDTGKNNRANGAVGTLQRASCVMPMRPLSITR